MGKQKRGEKGSSSSSQGEGALDSKKVRVMSGSKTEEDEHGVPNAQQTKLEEIASSILLRYTYTSGSLYCCTSGHVTLNKITLSHHGVGVDIITWCQK